MATYEYTAPDGNVYEFDGAEGFDDGEVKKEGARLFSELNSEPPTDSTTVTYEYTAPDGNVYEFDGPEGFDDEEVKKEGAQLFSVMQGGTQGAAEGLPQYFLEKSQRGFSSGLAIGESIIDTFFLDPFIKRPYQIVKAAVTGEAAPEYGGIVDRFGSNYNRMFNALTPYTGVEPEMTAPENSGYITQFVGSGIEAASDPLNYVGLGALKVLAQTGVKATLKKSAADSVTLFNLGVGMDVGGTLGEEAQKAVTGEETGTGGKVAGSLVGGGASVASSGVLRNAVKTGYGYARQMWGKYKNHKDNPTATVAAYSSGAAKRLLDFAANEKNLDNWEQVADDFKELGPLIGTDSFPLLVSMSDNSVLRSQVLRRAKQNPSFKAEVQEEIFRLSALIDSKAHDLFGPQYAVFNIAMAPKIAEEQATRAERIITIDNKIQELRQRFEVADDKETIGLAIENLISAKQALAIKENGVGYEALLKEARANKIKMPANNVRNIHNFIERNNLRDIFGVGTKAEVKIRRYWGPQINKETGKRIYKDVPFDQVESLKKAINKEIASATPGSDTARKLLKLKSIFEAARKGIPGDFNKKLADLDKLYYEKVGVPFGEQGVKEITAKKYAEDVAPVIVKSAERLDDFIGAVGEEGLEVARTALMSEMYQKVFKDGVLDPAAYKKYMNSKAAVIDRIPGLRKDLNAVLVDDSALKLQREALDNAAKAVDAQIANNYLLKNPELGPDYSTITSQMIGNNEQITKFFKNLEDVSPDTQQKIINTVRAELFNIARNSGDGMYQFLIKPSNRAVVSKLFGPKYIDQVKSIAKISDAIRLADVSKVSGKVSDEQLDIFAKIAPGMDIPYIASTFRDRISSWTQKGIRLLSRFQVAAGRNKTDEAIEQLLLDPQGVQKLEAMMKDLTKNKKLYDPLSFEKPTDLKTFVGTFTELLPSYFYETAQQGFEETEQ